MGESGKRIAVSNVHAPIPVAAPKGAIRAESKARSATTPTRTPQRMSVRLRCGLTFSIKQIRHKMQICRKKSEKKRYVDAAAPLKTPARARITAKRAVPLAEIIVGNNDSFVKSVLKRNV